MKKLIIAIVLMVGTLFSQAQINLCDSMTATGSQTQLTLQVNNVNTFIDYWVTTGNNGTILGEDSMSTTHNVFRWILWNSSKTYCPIIIKRASS